MFVLSLSLSLLLRPPHVVGMCLVSSLWEDAQTQINLNKALIL